MNNKNHYIALLLLLALMALAPALASRRKPAVSPADVADTMRVSVDSLLASVPAYDRLYLEGVCQQVKDNADEAQALFDSCVAIDPNRAEAYYRQALYYSAEPHRNDSLVIAYMRRAAELQPGNDTYQENVAQTYLMKNDYAAATEAYEQLYSHHHDRTDLLRQLLGLYALQKDTPHMLSTIDRMEQVDGPSDDFEVLRLNVYISCNDKKNTYRQLKKLSDTHPYDATYKVMLGNWLMNDGQKQQAYALFSDVLRDDPTNDEAQQSLYDYYRSEGNDTAAVRLRNDMLCSPRTATDTKISMLQQAIRESERTNPHDSVPMLQLFDMAIAATPHCPDMTNLKATYMYLKEMPHDSIIAAYNATLAFEPDSKVPRISIIQLLYDDERWNDVVKYATDGILYSPTEIRYYYFLGITYFTRLNDEQKALQTFRKGIANAVNDGDKDENFKSIQSDMYGLIGDIEYGNNHTAEAFVAYDSALQLKPDNNLVLNNYAYYLSLRSEQLDKAAAMSLKTITSEPTNAVYLDTYAWILYLQKRYDEAKAYIDLALQNYGDAATADIFEHAGDIYSCAGDAQGAKQYWQRAIDTGADKDKLMRKINTGKASQK